MKFLSALAAQTQQRLRRFIICASLAFAAALTGATGLGFATYALFQALRRDYGAINAAIALAAIYIVIAGLLALIARRAGRPARADASPPPQAASAATDPLSAAAQDSGAPQAAAVAMGVELAKQLTPLQLTLLAALSGFVAGRRL
jgi:putative superfamily III holin-X